MYLALLVGILDDLIAGGIHLDEGAIGQTRLFAAVRIDELADFVGKNYLARLVGMMLLNLAVGKLEDLQAVGVDYLRDLRLGVEVGLSGRVVVHLFAVAVKELHIGVPLVGAALLGSAVGKDCERGAVFE